MTYFINQSFYCYIVIISLNVVIYQFAVESMKRQPTRYVYTRIMRHSFKAHLFTCHIIIWPGIILLHWCPLSIQLSLKAKEITQMKVCPQLKLIDNSMKRIRVMRGCWFKISNELKIKLKLRIKYYKWIFHVITRKHFMLSVNVNFTDKM